MSFCSLFEASIYKNEIKSYRLLLKINLHTHTRQPMKSILHTKLNEIIAYMRPLLL